MAGHGWQVLLMLQLAFFGPLDTSEPVGYYIGAGEPNSGRQPGDAQLAAWALRAWERAAGGLLRFEPAPEAQARMRIRWVAAGGGKYGEMRPVLVRGKRGAELYVFPTTDALGPEIAAQARRDPLFRDAIVYLTCLHESGHGLGLEHTADYADIMYFFGHGGDIPGYFQRYRRQLRSRDDIPNHSGLSPGDAARLRRLYAPRR